MTDEVFNEAAAIKADLVLIAAFWTATALDPEVVIEDISNEALATMLSRLNGLNTVQKEGFTDALNALHTTWAEAVRALLNTAKTDLETAFAALTTEEA